MEKFTAQLEIIDGNPFVYLSAPVLEQLFSQAKKQKGTIPVVGTVNGKPFQQTLVKYRGHWRLYINMAMLKNSPRRIGEIIAVTIEFDSSDRSIEPHPKLLLALENNEAAKQVFQNLSPSRQKEIVRYISNLKTEKSVDRNVERAINFLLGKERFVGRDKP